MARALTAEWSHAGEQGRAAFLQRASARRDALRSLDCNYWVFEKGAEPGTFLEFMETRDPESLRVARMRVGADVDTAVLTAVELD